VAYYRECGLCGCALDPGEKCDCEKEAQEKQEQLQKMVFVGRNGQYAFGFTKEARSVEQAVV